MPSQYSNLNFVDKCDLANWKERCADQRKIAESWPAYDPRMIMCEDYYWKIGPWSVGLVLWIWQKPFMWDASATIAEHIGYETVAMDQGMYKGAKVEVPQDAMLAVSSWHPEHHEQARFLLNEILGPILRPGDKLQQATEVDTLFSKQALVRYEGDQPWKRKQH